MNYQRDPSTGRNVVPELDECDVPREESAPPSTRRWLAAAIAIVAAAAAAALIIPHSPQ